MNEQAISFNLIHLKEVDSTNTYLEGLSHKQQLEDFTTVITDFQSNGHGQGKNTWEAENKKNLLFSYILHPDFCKANRQFHLSQIAALGIKNVLEQYTTNISIKWPNDIYWKDKKICGMLIKNELFGEQITQSIFGIGINLNQHAFVSDAPNPISLSQITGQSYDIIQILSEVMSQTKKLYQLLCNEQTEVITQLYFEALYRKNGYHQYKDCKGMFSAEIVEILSLGTLVLRDDNELRREYNFKEVSFVL